MLQRKLKIFNLSLITFRKINGHSQQYIADHLDMSFRKYQRIEHGQAEIQVSDLYKLALLYKISACEFIEGARDCYPTTEVDNNFFEKNCDANIETFKKTLDGYLIPFLAQDSQENKEALLLNNNKFMNNEISMAFTNFKGVILNQKLLAETNRVGKNRVCVSKVSLNPYQFLGHLKKVILMDSNYYKAIVKIEKNDGKELNCEYLGYINREENNYYAIACLTKIYN